MRSMKKMTEKTGSPTECKILRFPDRRGPVLTTWGDLTGDYNKACVTKSSINLDPMSNQAIIDVFSEMVEKAVEQSLISGVPIFLLVETAVRQHGKINIQVAKRLGDALNTLRRAHDAQLHRLNTQDHPVVQGPRVPDPAS